ncbi:MAG: UvrD-helicase domain-containing protein, partial [Silanimonas sp.]
VRALAEADRAPVGTLHSLCHRILRDDPLNGALGFAPLELGDGRALQERLSLDLLRRIAHGDASPQALTLPKGAGDAESLAKRIRLLLQPGATVSLPAEPDALRAGVSDALRASIERLATREGHYKRADARPLKAATALRGWLDGDAVVPDVAALLGVGGLSSSVLPPAEALIREAGFQTEITALAEALQRLGDGERAFWAYWRPWLRDAQARHVAETGRLAFDQLVERVRDAMQREGSTLPAALAARWPVVLVDEFQDTDAAQYALLDAWQRAAAPRGLLAIVGDPKQAIYRFRGGDIGVYRRAAREVDARLALAVSQRSHSRYVAALNHVFAGPRAALSTRDAFDPIRVEPVDAAGRADAHALSVDGTPVARPLVLHEWPDEDGVASNAMARPRALRACAELVVQLLQPGRAQVGRRALVPGDIAVLLVSNAEVDALRRLLHRRGVPVVGQARQSVFATEAARDLRVALRAVLHPGDAGALRAGLLLPLFGVSAAALPALEAAGGLDAFRERCIGWRAQWQREGVLAVVHALLREALPRIGRGADGERRLTDLRHLGELLQDEASTHPRPEGLLDWLGQQLGDDDAMADGPNRLRLESDARRVRLMTLHGSKGLE